MNKLNSKINYESALDNINKTMRNPMLIHKIQDKLQELPGDGILLTDYRDGAKVNPGKVVKQIISDYQDNPQIVINTVGRPILDLIEEYEYITLADDIPTDLFTGAFCD